MKRKLCLLMASVVLTVSLAACGGASNTTTGSGTSAAGSDSGTTATTEKKDAKLSILTYSQSTAEYSEEMPVLAEIAKRTGIKLEWQNLPVGAEQEKLDLTFASGNLPDILLWTVKDYVDNLGQKGALIPLEQLVDQYSPNIKAEFSKLDTEIKGFRNKVTASDGHIYTIPAIIPDGYNAGEVFAIRQDWLDNVGMQMPVTTDDFYNVLKAFKEKDPNKNGEADEIPLIMRAADYYLEILAMNPFGVTSDIFWDETQQKVRFSCVEPEFKQGLEFLHKLYAEKLLDNEYITNTDDQWLAKMSNNQAGVMYGWPGGHIGVAHDALMKLDPSFNLVPMLPLTGPNGSQFKQDGQSRVSYRGSITKSCKDIESAMKLFDFMYSAEGQELDGWGIEGKTYVKLPDGSKQFLDYVIRNADGLPAGTVTLNYGISGPLPWVYEPDALKAQATPFVKKINELYMSKPNLIKEAFSATFTKDENDKLGKLGNDMFSNYVTPMISKFITGKEPLSKWDEYVSKAKSLGADEFTTIYDTAYNRTYNIK